MMTDPTRIVIRDRIMTKNRAMSELLFSKRVIHKNCRSKPERRTTRAATIKSSPAKSTARPGTPRFIGSDVESVIGEDGGSDEEENRVVSNTCSVTKSPTKAVRDGDADSDGSDIIYDGDVDK